MTGPLDPFPALKAVGRPILQSLCNEWCAGSTAVLAGVVGVTLSEDLTEVSPAMRGDAAYYEDGGFNVFFPCDDLIKYLVERAVDPSKRFEYLQRLKVVREKAGPDVFQRYVSPVTSFRMAIECLVCSERILTDYLVDHNDEFVYAGDPNMECPVCGCSRGVETSDFFRVLAPDSRK